MRLLIMSFGLILLDQATKLMVQQHMYRGQTIELVQNILSLTYLENPGAAFGIFPYRTTLFIIVTLAVIAFIFYYFKNLPRQYFLMRLGLALQLAGAIGNLIDRVRTGYVIDFIDLAFWPPIFNVADVAIVVGIIIFVCSFWRKEIVIDNKT